jgi:hypothetical protein
MSVATTLEVANLVNSYHLLVVLRVTRRNDKLLADSPVIASIRLLEICPATRTDGKYTLKVFISEVGQLYPALCIVPQRRHFCVNFVVDDVVEEVGEFVIQLHGSAPLGKAGVLPGDGPSCHGEAIRVKSGALSR